MTDRINILLATYNGGRYLEQQIDSVLAQTVTNWRLIIRDDCSTDNTREIIESYRAKYPDQFILLNDSGLRLGSCQNFACLLQYSPSEYIMFCDQDDVWLPHKIAVTLNKFRALERLFGRQTPLMVYTDLKVVNEHLDIISKSFWQLLRLKPQNGNKLNRLVLQSVANGCAMMINKPLRDMAIPLPAQAMMHDWWLTMVASAFGRSDFLPEATLLYRQHSKNVSGAENRGIIKIISDFFNSEKRKELTAKRNATITSTQKQAEAFLKQYSDVLTEKSQKMLQDFLEVNQKGFWARKYSILKNGFFYGNIIDNIGVLLFR